MSTLPSSSSWSKLETDVLFDLCEQFDLRFAVVADRYVAALKERYDGEQIKVLDLNQLSQGASHQD